MTAPFTLEAQVTDGPLIGRRLVVTWTYPDLRRHSVVGVRVEIKGELVPLDAALTVLAHTERTGPAEVEAEPSRVVDLMQALEASVEAAKAARARHPQPSAHVLHREEP